MWSEGQERRGAEFKVEGGKMSNDFYRVMSENIPLKQTSCKTRELFSDISDTKILYYMYIPFLTLYFLLLKSHN